MVPDYPCVQRVVGTKPMLNETGQYLIGLTR